MPTGGCRRKSCQLPGRVRRPILDGPDGWCSALAPSGVERSREVRLYKIIGIIGKPCMGRVNPGHPSTTPRGTRAHPGRSDWPLGRSCGLWQVGVGAPALWWRLAGPGEPPYKNLGNLGKSCISEIFSPPKTLKKPNCKCAKNIADPQVDKFLRRDLRENGSSRSSTISSECETRPQLDRHLRHIAPIIQQSSPRWSKDTRGARLCNLTTVLSFCKQGATRCGRVLSICMFRLSGYNSQRL